MAGTETETQPRIAGETMRAFMERFFIRLGVPAADAATAADVLLYSDIHAIDSHGIPRLRMYAQFIAEGRINLHPTVTVVDESDGTLTLDGDNGLGLVVAPEAMRRCIAKARASGWCTTTMRKSNHFGAASYYPMMAIRAGMGGIGMTNAPPLVVPTFARTSVIGTNPLAIGFPGGNESDPFLLDMATSSVAWGKVEIARREGKSIPLGWAMDESGAFTTDPHAAVALAPLGSDREHSSQKGYGLGVAVDLFCGLLSGGAWSKHVTGRREATNQPPNTCHCFMAWRIDAFVAPEVYRTMMDDFMSSLKAAPPAPGHDAVLAPGQPEFDGYRDRSVHGIPLHQSVRDDLRALAAEFDVPYDLD